MTSLHGYKETLTFDNSKLSWLAAGGRENGENCGGALSGTRGAPWQEGDQSAGTAWELMWNSGLLEAYLS